MKDADLNEEEILDSLTLLSWYIDRFLKSLVRNIFPATKLIAETYTKLIPKLPETLHYNYDPNWFPQNVTTNTKVSSQTLQKLSINHKNIDKKNCNAENQPFTFTDTPKTQICLSKHHR